MLCICIHNIILVPNRILDINYYTFITNRYTTHTAVRNV